MQDLQSTLERFSDLDVRERLAPFRAEAAKALESIEWEERRSG